METTVEFRYRRRRLHERQQEFVAHPAKRKVVRAGRRSGKTVGVADLAASAFAERGRRVLYATPTQDQVGRFWYEVKRAFRQAVARGILRKDETEHVIEWPDTNARIRAKTAWNADTLRGDYADLLILDEFQLMNEDAWELVGAPMLLDNNGDAVFIYTPPSLRSAGGSKARDPRHAAKLFQRAQADATGRWAAFHFTSHDNPFISREALDEISRDMTRLAYLQEIMAEDIEDAPGALWKRDLLEQFRVLQAPPLLRVVVAVDPEATSGPGSAETGIVAAGLGADRHYYVLADDSLRASPHGWATQAIAACRRLQADRLVAEANNGGEMVEHTLRTVDPAVPYRAVHASRGKQVRAEPIVALYEQGKVHHVGSFPALEDQLCQWVPGDPSPDRLDALVWAMTELAGGASPAVIPIRGGDG
ncbi:MAG: ATP-binding protein [Chloroflexi bacterium]|nr:ATP-binding protein [Chloroflexota bacterium]